MPHYTICALLLRSFLLFRFVFFGGKLILLHTTANCRSIAGWMRSTLLMAFFKSILVLLYSWGMTFKRSLFPSDIYISCVSWTSSLTYLYDHLIIRFRICQLYTKPRFMQFPSPCSQFCHTVLSSRPQFPNTILHRISLHTFLVFTTCSARSVHRNNCDNSWWSVQITKFVTSKYFCGRFVSRHFWLKIQAFWNVMPCQSVSSY